MLALDLTQVFKIIHKVPLKLVCSKNFYEAKFINQPCASLWLMHAQFLKITFVRMLVRMCVHAPKPINY